MSRQQPARPAPLQSRPGRDVGGDAGPSTAKEPEGRVLG